MVRKALFGTYEDDDQRLEEQVVPSQMGGGAGSTPTPPPLKGKPPQKTPRAGPATLLNLTFSTSRLQLEFQSSPPPSQQQLSKYLSRFVQEVPGIDHVILIKSTTGQPPQIHVVLQSQQTLQNVNSFLHEYDPLVRIKKISQQKTPGTVQVKGKQIQEFFRRRTPLTPAEPPRTLTVQFSVTCPPGYTQHPFYYPTVPPRFLQQLHDWNWDPQKGILSAQIKADSRVKYPSVEEVGKKLQSYQRQLRSILPEDAGFKISSSSVFQQQRTPTTVRAR